MATSIDELGSRIAEARQRVGLTQKQCAEKAGLDRSSLSKIETGIRRTTVLELVNIADALDMRMEWLLEDAPPAIVSRRNASDPGEPSTKIDLAVERVAREVEFLRTLDGEPDLRSPSTFGMPRTESEIEDCARKARKLLGYGLEEPAVGLGVRVAEIGLLAFTLPLGEESADGASVLLTVGGVAVVNGTKRLGRRRLTLAHELGHFLFADEYSIDWRVADEQTDGHEIRIDRFARALLLPQKSMRALWPASPDEESLRLAAVTTASEFQVDMATLAQRLRETGLATPEQTAQVRSFRTTRADIVDFGLVVPPASQELTTPDLPRLYEKAVLNAYRKDIISPGRATELLFNTWDEADLPDLPLLPEDAIWSFVS
ncbi:MAG: helix-turn-helix domain-containing protein [Acidimicrobiia bacterium]|nr:helix-turn-helix domain-containing protein [Acidimicrobiia bacterium]MCY4433695.1 XRE family transcriptional regulator [bacterium]